MTDESFPAEGGCTCGEVRYRLMSGPLIVHACHCRWCQRETGSAFALNALIEADRVVLLAGAPEIVDTPSESGRGQKIHRCPTCRVALWSNYAGAGDAVRFVRVGTQPWVVLPPGTPAVAEYYDRDVFGPRASLERRRALLERLRAESE
jgi:hypothetical protein